MSFLHFLWGQWIFTPPYPTESFKGQTIIVTGANTGLGKEACRHFVRLGAEKVIIACRRVSAGEEAKADIEKTTQRTGVLEVWDLDLASHDSIKAFAKRAQQLPRLDCLLENAGLAGSAWQTIDGVERCIAINVISTMLLGILLLPKLKETATKYNVRPNLTIVTSEVHAHTECPERKIPGKLFDNLNVESIAAKGERYPVSKLLLTVSYRSLVEEYFSPADKSPVTINILNPGLCYSELSRETGFTFRIMQFVFGARSTEVGSRTLVNGAIAGPESHGQYLSNCQVEDMSPFIFTEEGQKLQKRTWEELKEMLEKDQPGLFAKL